MSALRGSPCAAICHHFLFLSSSSGFHMTVVWSPRIQHTDRAQFEKTHMKGECIFEFKVQIIVQPCSLTRPVLEQPDDSRVCTKA